MLYARYVATYEQLQLAVDNEDAFRVLEVCTAACALADGARAAAMLALDDVRSRGLVRTFPEFEVSSPGPAGTEARAVSPSSRPR